MHQAATPSSTATADAAAASFRPFYDAWLDHMLKIHDELSSRYVDLPEEVVRTGKLEWERGNQAYLAKVRCPHTCRIVVLSLVCRVLCVSCVVYCSGIGALVPTGLWGWR